MADNNPFPLHIFQVVDKLVGVASVKYLRTAAPMACSILLLCVFLVSQIY